MCVPSLHEGVLGEIPVRIQYHQDSSTPQPIVVAKAALSEPFSGREHEKQTYHED